MTRSTVDRWLGGGVLLVMALTIGFANWVHWLESHPPVLLVIPTRAQSTAYRELSAKTITLQDARAIAVKDKVIFIAGDHAVQAINRLDGSRGISIPLDGAPSALAVAANGTLYLGIGDRVEVYNGQQRTARWTARPDMLITAMAAGKDVVWVADVRHKVILGYDFTGKVIAVLGQKDEAKGISGLEAPGGHLDVALAQNGEILVTNPGRHQVEVYNKSGKLLRKWGLTGTAPGGFSGCCNPVALAVESDDSVITAEKGQPRLQQFSADGTYQNLVANLRNGAGWDIAVGENGDIFLLDPKAKTVRIFEKDESHAK